MALANLNPSDGRETPNRILEHILKHGDDLAFAEFFWKKCEPHPYELNRYPKYVKVLQLFAQGIPPAEISRRTAVNDQSVRSWTRFEQKPKLAHYLGLYLQLGSPRPDWVWLSVNNTSGHAVPLGPVIQVPKAIMKWEEFSSVVGQLEPLEPVANNLSREYLTGFLLGMIIGDAAKSRAKNWHRHLGLVMSKRYETNRRIGDFTCVCARNLGFRMHRVADQPKPKNKPNGFYQWVSQASPLVDWLFNVALGLKDGEKTTYNPVRMNWVLDSPVEFRRGIVQGIAESDGSVNIASQTVEFWIEPSRDFFGQVLDTFGVRSFRSREALSVSKAQIVKLGVIPPFSPILRTVRYLRFEKLVGAQHIGHGKRIPFEIRSFLVQNAQRMSVPELSERALDKFGVALSFEAVQRWARKALISDV